MEHSLLRVRIAVLMVVSLLASTFPFMPARAAALPMENPDTALVVYDGAALFQKLSQAVSLISNGDKDGLGSLKQQAEFANIPPELKNAINNYMASAVIIADLVPKIQSDLANAKTVVTQYRIADAASTLAAAKDKLNQSYSGLLTMDKACGDAGRYWYDNLTGNLLLNQSYNEARGQLQKLRSLLDSMGSTYSSLMKYVPDTSLRSTNLSLAVNPGTAFVGDNVELQGFLASNGVPLEGRIVDLTVDNITVATVLTGPDGLFRSVISIPFKYVQKMDVQAVFNPSGSDIGRYHGSSSTIFPLNVLYYQGDLRASQGTPAYPGRDFTVTSFFTYHDSPQLDNRQLIILLDTGRVFDGVVGQTTSVRIPVAPNVSPGSHDIYFLAPAYGRYAPAEYALPVEINLAVPVIELNTSRLLFLPFSHEVKGRVYSPVGPLRNADVAITMGGWKASTVTREDGTFSAQFGTGLSLTLIGRQAMRVSVKPAEPWNGPASLDVPFTITNPLSIAAILMALSIPIWLFFKRKKGVQLVPPPHSLTPKSQDVIVDALKVKGNSLLINLYKSILALIQAASGLMLQPYQTLGEFAVDAGPKLGLLAGYFQELTRIIERQLYSNRANVDADSERAKELGRTLINGMKK